MTLHRLILHPRSPWRTPWQADTLAGMLLATCARVHGPEVLRDQLIEPMLAGRPPFVLSDACPGDLLPMPITLRLADWPPDTDRKTLKRKRWLTPDAFQQVRAGQTPALEQLLADDDVLLQHARHHNTLSRLTDATGDAEAGLAPFSRAETMLRHASEHHDAVLSIYFRILQPDAADLLLDLFHELALTGFGADVATGRGQFDIEGDPQPAPDIDAPAQTTTDLPIRSNAVLCLSTFQPATGDPTDGYWDAFPKYGKLGPELASLAGRHLKNTCIMFRPGAVFHAQTPMIQRAFLGRAIPAAELLPEGSAQSLAQHNIRPIHPAFALTIPMILPKMPSLE